MVCTTSFAHVHKTVVEVVVRYYKMVRKLPYMCHKYKLTELLLESLHHLASGPLAACPAIARDLVRSPLFWHG
jgi:hypothetical protein